MFLNAASLDAAAFASPTKDRVVLSSLNISPTHCVATDSYHLIEVEHPKPDGLMTPDGIRNDSSPGMIPAESALHARKNIPKGDSLFALKHAFSSVDADGKRMTLTTSDLVQEKSVEAPLIEGSYPAYESIFPRGEPIGVIQLDARYLKDVAEYFAKHGEAKRVLIEFHGENSSLVFRGEVAGTGQAIRAVVMPQRIYKPASNPSV